MQSPVRYVKCKKRKRKTTDHDVMQSVRQCASEEGYNENNAMKPEARNGVPVMRAGENVTAIPGLIFTTRTLEQSVIQCSAMVQTAGENACQCHGRHGSHENVRDRLTGREVRDACSPQSTRAHQRGMQRW